MSQSKDGISPADKFAESLLTQEGTAAARAKAEKQAGCHFDNQPAFLLRLFFTYGQDLSGETLTVGRK